MLLELFFAPPELLYHGHHEGKRFPRASASIYCYIFVPTKQRYGGFLHRCGCLETQRIKYLQRRLADTSQIAELP